MHYSKFERFWRPMFWLLGSLLILHVLAERIKFPGGHVFTILLISIAVSAAMRPLVARLAEWHVPRELSIIMIDLVFAALFVLCAVMLIPLVRTQILAIAVELPQHWDNVQLRLREVFPPWVIDTFSPGLKAKVPEITSSLFDFAANLSGFVGKVLSFSFDTVLVMIISFFLAKEDGLILRFINQYVHPGKRADIGALVSGILSKLGQWGFAQILSALYFGAVFWAFLFCFGIPYATTICLMGTLFEAIVPFGSVCALGLALFVATVHLPSWGPYVVLGAYLLTTFTQNHVFVPRLMNHFFKLHSLMTILAMWILYLIMGVIGTLLAMPVTVIAMDVFYYLRPRWDEDETAVSSAPEPDQLPPPDTSKVQRTIKPKLVTGRPRPKRRRAGR